MPAKTALVTGASSGIGAATARKLATLGYTVYGAARRVDRMDALKEHDIRPLAMDVTDETSVQEGLASLLAEAGRIDVLVNNAGYGSYGAVEDVSLDEARAQFEVNVFGAARLIQLLLPTMRAQHGGRIINVSAMGGKIYTPLGAWYHATKFAIEGLSDCLRLEVAPFGIDVVLVEPGAIDTEWGSIAADKLRDVSEHGAYATQAEAMARTLLAENPPVRPSAATVVADAIGKAVTARRPRTRYVVGSGARPLIAARRLLPDRGYDALIRRVSGMPRS